MRLRTLVTLLAGAALVLPAGAAADFQTFYDDYRADGVIDGCSQSPGALTAALGDIPADVREYDPAFADAINTALEQAATGCGTAPRKAAAAIKNEVISQDGSPGPAVLERAALPVPETGRDIPPVLVALSLLLAAALAFAALVVASERFGWDLRGRLAPVGGALRGAERRISDRLRSRRNRSGS